MRLAFVEKKFIVIVKTISSLSILNLFLILMIIVDKKYGAHENIFPDVVSHLLDKIERLCFVQLNNRCSPS